MGSQQDQAARVERGRSASALATGDGDGRVGPGVRVVLTSVLLAVLGVGGSVAWTQFTGGPPDTWRDRDVLVVEQETGARFVWHDGVLRPVPNFVSAQLILRQRAPQLVSVPRAVLASVPRGAPLGLPDAPESFPAPQDLTTGPWSVCSVGDAATPARSVLLVGAVPDGGEPLGERALLVRDPDGTRHVIWRRQRHRLGDPELTLPALGWVGRSPVPVAAAPLVALPAGAEFGAVDIPGRGQPSVAVPQAVIGQVFVVTGWASGSRYAVALRDGLAPLTAVQVDLVLTDPRTVAAVGQRAPVPLPAAEYASLPQLDAGALGGAGLPEVVPALVDLTSAAAPAGGSAPAGRPAVCAVVAGPGGAIDVLLNPILPPAASAVPTGGAGTADLVVVPMGGGVLVRDGDGVSVVSGPGRRHRIDPRVRDLLGYGQSAPVDLPAAVVSLVPAGPEVNLARVAVPGSELSTGERSGLPPPDAGG